MTDHETDYESPRKHRRRKDAYVGVEQDESPRRSKHYRRGVDSEPEERMFEDARKSRDDRKKGRVVSGAIVEEGRAVYPGIRGGLGSKHSSYDSYDSILNEKNGLQKPRPPANKKKRRCQSPTKGLPVTLLLTAF